MATIEQYPLERKKILKRWLNASIGWAVLALVGTFVASLAAQWNAMMGIAAFFIGTALLSGWQYLYETRYFTAYYYDIGKDFLAIRKGWITPREVQLPYEKMQDVYMDQDIFDRVFGLWDVHVSTATMMSGMEAHMDGVNRTTAEKLREMLLDKIKSKRGKVTGYD